MCKVIALRDSLQWWMDKVSNDEVSMCTNDPYFCFYEKLSEKG